MEENPRYVGIDVSKAQVDVAVRPTGQRWAASYNETGVGELVSQMVDIGPTMVLLEATGGLELPLVAALAAAALPVVVVVKPASSPALALGKPVRSRPGPIARPAAPFLTAPSVPDPLTGQPKGCPPHTRASPVRQRHFWPAAWPISPTTATVGCHLATGVATARYPQPHLLGSGLACSSSLAHHPSCQRQNRIPSVDSGLGNRCARW